MSNLLHRATDADLELRGTDGRTVVGLCVPFDTPAHIREVDGSEFTESVQRGAFAKTIAERGAERVKFLSLHDRKSMPLGRAVLLREDASGLYGEFKVSKTQAGDEALELIRDGALDGLSIGFRVISDRWQGLTRTISEIALHEVSAVSFPAYDGARITGTRSIPQPLSVETAAQRLRLL